MYSKHDVLQPDWTPIEKRSANIKLSSSIKCKRIQFPLVGANALTVHKSQGGTFSEIAYEYGKGQEQQLVYVGMSRVTSIEGLYLTNNRGIFKFYHAKGTASPRIQELRTELRRLENHKLVTLGTELLEFISNVSHFAVLLSLNVQSSNARTFSRYFNRCGSQTGRYPCAQRNMDGQ